MAMSDVQLREATEADVPTIFAVTRAAFGEYLGRLDPPSGVHRETLDSLREKLASGHTARARGRPRVRLGVRVALARLRARYERLGYRVVEEHRHAGYAEPTYVMMEK